MSKITVKNVAMGLFLTFAVMGGIAKYTTSGLPQCGSSNVQTMMSRYIADFLGRNGYPTAPIDISFNDIEELESTKTTRTCAATIVANMNHGVETSELEYILKWTDKSKKKYTIEYLED